jgi:hypothetical protein
MASGAVLGWPSSWDELAAGAPGKTLRLGCTHHPDAICRTAGDVIRRSGGVGRGEAVRSLPIPIRWLDVNGTIPG